MPDGTLERPIAGSRLSPFDPSNAGTASYDLAAFAGEKFSVEVYPNPVKGEKLTVTIGNLSGSDGQPGELVIRQLTGRTVYRETLNCSEGCTAEINVQDGFTPGIYILQVKAGDKHLRRN